MEVLGRSRLISSSAKPKGQVDTVGALEVGEQPREELLMRLRARFR
jgi:hypothetical protein